MKYLLIIIFVLFSLDGFSQGQWNNQSVNTKVNRLKGDSVVIVPRDTSATNNALDPKTGSPVGDSGRIAYKGQKFWGHYGSLGWQQIGSGSSSVGGAIDTAHTVEDLMSYNASLNTVIVSEKYRGGIFTYIPLPSIPSVDSGIVFPATGKGGGVWYRHWDLSTIQASWFGVIPGMTDASRGLNRAIEVYSPSGPADTIGIAIQLPRGLLRLKEIVLRKGVKIYADQSANNNYIAYVQTQIKPVIGTTGAIFRIVDTAMNVSLEHLYIDCDFTNSPNLQAAIIVAGQSNYFNDLNIINAPDYAVYGSFGLSKWDNSTVQGMAAPVVPFANFNDFHGACHFTAMGDSKIDGVEFAANAPYLIGQVVNPADILRDPVNARYCAFVVEILANSWIVNSYFENGDQGFVAKAGIRNNLSNNHYEMNAFRGVLWKGMQQSTEESPQFGNNSLALNGQGEDFRLDTFGVVFCDIKNPHFNKLQDLVRIPTSYYKVKYNIVNLSGNPLANSMLSPTFSDTSAAARYDSLGHYDLTGLGVSFRHIVGQPDPQNPTFDGLNIGGNGFRDPWSTLVHRGMVELVAGATAGAGGASGAIRFTNESGGLMGSIGGDAFTGMTFLSGGNATFLTAGMIHAKTGGTNVNMISDNTGISTVQFSSDPIPTRLALMQFYNATGDFTLSASRHIYLGLNNNFEMNFNGQNYLRNTPDYAVGDTTFSFLVRKNDGGQIQIKAKAYIDSLISGGSAPTLQAVTDAGNTTSNAIIVNKIGINTTPINHLEVDGSVGFPLFVFSVDNLPFGASDYSLGINNTGIGTVTLPDAAVYPNRICEVKKVSATGILVNIVSSGGTIDGVSTKTLNVQNSWMRFQSDGANWRVMGQNLLDGISTTRLINTTAPLAGGGDLSADRTLTIANAAADGSTKGAASFTANDFDASSGNISIDYTNGQTAGTATKGFLSATDWNIFNNKIGTLNTLTGASQTFATGTTGTDFNISSASTTHTFNIPSMAVSGATRGLLTNTTQVLPGDKSLTGVTTLASGWATGSFAFGATAPPSTARVNILSATTSGLYIINSATIGAATGGFARLMNSGTASAADQRMGGIIFGTNPSGTNFRSMGSIEMLSEAAHTDNVSQPSYMRFLTTPVSTAAAVERMRITAGGDLGLGTLVPTSPAAFRVFHINDGTSGSSPGIHITNDATGGAVGDGTMMWVGNASAAGNTSFNIYNQENSPIALFTSSTERLRVLGNGNVLIGTTTDGGQKLQVNGNANVSGIAQTVGLGVSGPASFNGGITVNNQTLTGSGSLSVGGPLVIYVNNTGTATITLPTAASASGYIQYIKKVSAATNNVVINVTSSGTIDGGASVTMLTQNSCVGLQSNGTEWKIISAYVGGAAF